MSRYIISAVMMVTLILYPVIVYFLFDESGVQVIGYLLLVIAMLRLGMLSIVRSKQPEMSRNHLLQAIISGGLGGLVIFSGDVLHAKLYPLCISFIFLYAFAHSLKQPTSAVERMARIVHANLPNSASLYLKKVTIVWCIFFVFNMLVSATTALYFDIKIWVLYNGLVSYILMGFIFLAEFIVRQFVIKKTADVSE